jgi:hypothetical protein
LGCVAAIDSNGRTIRIADAHRDGKRFVVHADGKLTAFVELESATRGTPSFTHPCTVSDTVQAQKRTTKVSSTYNANSAIIKTDLIQAEDLPPRQVLRLFRTRTAEINVAGERKEEP